MVRPERFELPTYSSGGCRSIQTELRAHKYIESTTFADRHQTGHPVALGDSEKRAYNFVGVAMSKLWSIVLLLTITSLTLTCGTSGSNRQLQSIAINSVTNGEQIQFLATGTFSAPPITVSPLPVSWSLDVPPPQYTLTTEPYTFQCQNPGPFLLPLVAIAPADPNAPSTGSIYPTNKMISALARIYCP